MDEVENLVKKWLSSSGSVQDLYRVSRRPALDIFFTEQAFLQLEEINILTGLAQK